MYPNGAERPAGLEPNSSPDGELRRQLIYARYRRVARGRLGIRADAGDPAVGRLFGVDGGKLTGTCSGTVGVRNLVITAAHCVNHSGYSYAPQQYGTSVPYGYWYATAYFVASQVPGR